MIGFGTPHADRHAKSVLIGKQWFPEIGMFGEGTLYHSKTTIGGVLAKESSEHRRQKCVHSLHESLLRAWTLSESRLLGCSCEFRLSQLVTT